MTMNVGIARLVGAVHEADHTRAGIEAFAAGEGRTLAEMGDKAMEAVEVALMHGLLELAPS
jgi:hypothetical protein